jgi:N-acetylglucosamine kinase-like BadF-type ATPase
MTEELVLAIDGGGTATSAALVDGRGHLLWRGQGGRANPTDSTDEMLLREWQGLLAPAVEYAPGKMRIFAGVAGGSHPRLGRRLSAVLWQIFPGAESITVTHDGINALYRGTHGRPGVAVIAGTGSVVLARGTDGRETRAGGWGYLVGDEGSGYDMGSKAVRAVLAAHDGMGPATKLTVAVLEVLGAGNPLDIVPIVYAGGRTCIASLAPSVIITAEDGDTVAAEIVRTSAKSLSLQLCAVLSRFECQRPVPVVLSGGVWNSALSVEVFKTAYAAAGEVRWIDPVMPAVYGAAVQEMGLRGVLPTMDYARTFALTSDVDYNLDEGDWPWII